jgi:hypothetical protein
LRPKFAATPIATPASAAPSSGPALSPHEKALRLPLLLLRLSFWSLRFALLRLELRVRVRVAI